MYYMAYIHWMPSGWYRDLIKYYHLIRSCTNPLPHSNHPPVATISTHLPTNPSNPTKHQHTQGTMSKRHAEDEGSSAKKVKLSDDALAKSYAEKWAEDYLDVLKNHGKKLAKSIYQAISEFMMEEQDFGEEESDDGDGGSGDGKYAEGNSDDGPGQGRGSWEAVKKAKTPAQATLVEAFAKEMAFEELLEFGRGALQCLDTAIGDAAGEFMMEEEDDDEFEGDDDENEEDY